MDFGDLSQFLDDCLRDEGNDGETECPQSKDEFLSLLKILRQKKVATPKLPDLSDPPPQFAPSESLLVLRAKQGRFAAWRREALRDSAVTKQTVRALRRKLKFLKAKADTLEAAERQEHADTRHYREAKAAYESSVRQRKEAQRRRHKLEQRQQKTLKRIKKDIRRAFGSDGRPVPRQLSWRLLPSGQLSRETLRRHYETLGHHNPHVAYDVRRIDKAFSLRPDGCYVGTDKFDGYVLFTFGHTNKVLLECPVYGNAIYILGPDWRRLTKESKQELLSGYPSGVEKIVHKGEWFGKVKVALGIR